MESPRPSASFYVKLRGSGQRSETVIGVSGNLDWKITPILKRTLERVDPAAVDVVVVDLANATMVDSAGWRLIGQLQDRCRQAGCELKIRQGLFAPTELG